MQCAGILLTGGASRRMGRDKALIPLDGATMAARAASVLRAVAAPVVEVGGGATDLPHVREQPSGSGPLAAIGAGAAAIGRDLPVIVLACDMPNVGADLLRWLADHPASGSVVPVFREPQPLCARWSIDALASIPSLLASGERSMRRLLEHPDVTLIPPTEWEMISGLEALDDVDTPAELERLSRRRRGDP
ncbi:MAG: molybdenum cofactor guanylyltransferase [Acidimicrobiales bacterium]